MAMAVNTNIASINAQRALVNTTSALTKSFERLSSGLRVNTASDDSAALAVAEKMRASVRSMSQASRNAQDGISLLQTAEGAYAEITNILIRMRELAVQSANGVLTNSDRSQLQTEYGQLLLEINRLTSVTTFNGLTLVTGSTNSVTLQIGINDVATADQLSVSLRDADATALGVATTSVSTIALSQSALALIDSAIGTVNTARAVVGSGVNRLSSAIASLATTVENLSAAQSRIRDVDVANQSATLVRDQILQQAGVSVLAQANSQPQLALRLLG